MEAYLQGNLSIINIAYNLDLESLYKSLLQILFDAQSSAVGLMVCY